MNNIHKIGEHFLQNKTKFIINKIYFLYLEKKHGV